MIDKVKARFTTRKLRRVTEDEWVGGVCAGVAYWLGIPVWLTRLTWSCLALFYGFGGVLYVLLWIFMPEWGKTPIDYKVVTGD